MIITQSVVTLAANTDTVVCVANASVHYLSVMNIGANQASLGFDAAAVAGSGWTLDAGAASGRQGGAVAWEGAGVPTNAIHAISAAGTVLAILTGVA